MSIKNTIPISEARKEIFSIAEHVQRPGEFYTLTEKGRPKVVIISAAEFESLVETLEVLRLFPDFEDNIAIAQNEYRQGDYITLDDILAKEGYVKNNTEERKHRDEVHRSHPAKRTKRSR